MLVRNSNRIHPEFDLAEARRIFADAGADRDLSGEFISSPHHLFSVETLRDRYKLRTGVSFPTDVFVFGKGKSPRADGTQVGGTPYWPADRRWPTISGGVPYLFLAQFNFADSRDLVSDLPGDVLLVLVHHSEEWLWQPERLRFEWLPSGLTPCSEFDPSLVAEKAGPFYGVIYRSMDYPDGSGKASDLNVAQCYNLPVLNGTKIGGLPHFIQGGDEAEGAFLCQLGSIQAAADVPYPWVNRPEPLGLGFDERGIYGEGNQVVFGDMGSLFLFRNRDGTVRCSFECY